jgi:hypothetical protein
MSCGGIGVRGNDLGTGTDIVFVNLANLVGVAFGGQSAPDIRIQWYATLLYFGTDTPVKQDDLVVV